MAAQTNFIDIATIWLHAGKGGDDTLFALVDGTVRFERVGKSGKKCSVKQ